MTTQKRLYIWIPNRPKIAYVICAEQIVRNIFGVSHPPLQASMLEEHLITSLHDIARTSIYDIKTHVFKRAHVQFVIYDRCPR